MRLRSPSSTLQALRREIRDVTREEQVHLRHACACGMRMHLYARVHVETKPRTSFYEWVHRGERDKAKGRKLPSNIVCATCVSDFYLPLTITILDSSVCPFLYLLFFIIFFQTQNYKSTIMNLFVKCTENFHQISLSFPESKLRNSWK